jgi:hypothetical protein
VDEQKHPACDCTNDQNVIRTSNDLLALLSIMAKDNRLCALNALVCAHLLVVYLKDVISDDPEAELLNKQAAAKAEDIYVYSQAHVEHTYNVRTTLSNKRGKLC